MPPPANPLALPSLVLALFVLGAAGGLATLQAAERRRREEEELGEADVEHYRRRDVRRRRGIILMGLIGLAASTGAWVNPRAGLDEARLVFGAWMIVGILLVVLLGLAVIDWFVTAAYGIRQRRRLARERQQLLDAFRERSGDPSEP